MSGDFQLTSRLISDARLNRLLNDAGGDEALARAIFSWNISAAGAAMEAIQVFELILRNAIDHELRAWHLGLAGTTEWLLNPHPYVLKVVPKSQIDLAREHARRIATERNRACLHDDVLAQLSLGVWRYVLPSNANAAKRKLWDVALHRAFPNWIGTWDPQSIIVRVANAHELRNRVAHLEPLHGYDLRRARRDMRSVMHAIGPGAARVFVATERLLDVIAQHPLDRGRD